MEPRTRLGIYEVLFCVLIVSIIILVGFTIIPFDAMSAGSVTYETTNPIVATIFAIIALTSGGLLIVFIILEIIYKFKKIKSLNKK